MSNEESTDKPALSLVEDKPAPNLVQFPTKSAPAPVSEMQSQSGVPSQCACVECMRLGKVRDVKARLLSTLNHVVLPLMDEALVLGVSVEFGLMINNVGKYSVARFACTEQH